MVSPCVFIFVFLLRKRKVLKIYNSQSTYKKHKTKGLRSTQRTEAYKVFKDRIVRRPPKALRARGHIGHKSI